MPKKPTPFSTRPFAGLHDPPGVSPEVAAFLKREGLAPNGPSPATVAKLRDCGVNVRPQAGRDPWDDANAVFRLIVPRTVLSKVDHMRRDGESIEDVIVAAIESAYVRQQKDVIDGVEVG